MANFALSLLFVPILAGVVTADSGDVGLPIDRNPVPTAQDPTIVCSLPGNLSNFKIPADSLEVANECSQAGTTTILRAIWWGGYMNWHPGDPEINCFDVRFYDSEECGPSSLIAAYDGAIPDTTHLGNCSDGLPCFRYELDVSVEVGPRPFFFSVVTACRALSLYPPKWGRLGNQVDDGCSSVWGLDGGGWDEVPTGGHIWDASQEFLAGEPTATYRYTWGEVKRRYR